MDARSDLTPTHPDGPRLSSSLPHQNWFQASYSHPAGPPAASISPQVRFRHGGSALDESTLARRTTAFRQLNGNSKPLSRRHRETKSIGGRPSTLASQPVLVRAYPDAADEAQSSSTMPSASATQQQRVPELPSVQDFSIEGILRAIEPEIRSTLDSIAEICGRSRLSLANEYGSHIAPFGEIRAPPGGLLTVEEASASSERLTDDNVAIVDDDNSLLDGRDYYATSTYGLLENLRQTAYATGYQRSPHYLHEDSSSVQAQPDMSGSSTVVHPTSDNDPKSRSSFVTKQFTTKPKPGSRALLGNAQSGAKGDAANIVTPAMLSEVHVDAPANRSSWPSVPPDTSHGSPNLAASNYPGTSRNGSASVQPSRVDKLSLMADVQGWLAWLKGIVQREKPQRASSPETAETTLRAVLERHAANVLRTHEQAVAVTTG
ncbi:hypothetical protein VTN96DRAFT_25 [Rasamsonia emersonii]|uniref:Uncharacterized protein n=1 Tax=Rasamsonia emersonii (strain ATCC 16479 / CBS 393.64 / IMI 116815) TaxID=1408163 RepID=A0A0F4YF11_RASE3|nr:hypothetical protein T310_9828 [Rasamsonia emersonii CBS 393.64]KKA16561.1 hypothetical protein T310_9828 [Rasamsonia emersonii CBS 393.64]